MQGQANTDRKVVIHQGDRQTDTNTIPYPV